MSSLVSALLARWKFDNGSARVRPINGTGKSSKNRLNNPDTTYLESTNSCTWTSNENVTEVYITLYGDTASTSDDYGLAVFDSLDATHAESLLSQAGGSSSDVQVFPLKYGERNGPFTGVSYFSRLDVDVTLNATMIVEAQ